MGISPDKKNASPRMFQLQAVKKHWLYHPDISQIPPWSFDPRRRTILNVEPTLSFSLVTTMTKKAKSRRIVPRARGEKFNGPSPNTGVLKVSTVAYESISPKLGRVKKQIDMATM
mmetsp:Transcript_38157/g.85798  ORF Transcript_38157/g.85798 Transcript_38157/m.85798 type:complete len:115 (+) Transcript_38157:656-1000(+)